jgi:hypothetical protein
MTRIFISFDTPAQMPGNETTNRHCRNRHVQGRGWVGSLCGLTWS